MKPAPPPMQTLMTPLAPISSGCLALKSLMNVFPILLVFYLWAMHWKGKIYVEAGRYILRCVFSMMRCLVLSEQSISEDRSFKFSHRIHPRFVVLFSFFFFSLRHTPHSTQHTASSSSVHRCGVSFFFQEDPRSQLWKVTLIYSARIIVENLVGVMTISHTTPC